MNYKSQYPPTQSTVYVKVNENQGTPPSGGFYVTDPVKPLTGTRNSNSWMVWGQYSYELNQRFHIDLGSGKVIKRIYYENFHDSGTETDIGVQNFTFWGSNDVTAFDELGYGTDTNWTQLTTSQATFDQHTASDVADPKYIEVTNTTSYRYYAFKFVDNYGDTYMTGSRIGIRRLELQTVIPGEFKFLAHCNGYNNGIIFIDECGHIPTIVGSPVTKTDIKKFGSASFYSPDSTNYVLFGNSADYNLGTADFTLPLWVYTLADGRGQSLISRRPSAVPYGWTIFIDASNKINFAAYVGSWTNPFLIGTTSVTPNTLHYIELSRKGSDWYLSLDGNLEATTSNAGVVNDLNSLTLGSSSDSGEGNMYGYLDEVALIVGEALHTSFPFIPPTVPFKITKYNSNNPPAYSDTYVKATTTYANPAFKPYFPTDYSKSLIGSADANVTWYAADTVVTNQRFHIDLGVEKKIKRIYYENFHHNGGNTNSGVREFTIWGSNREGDFDDVTWEDDHGPNFFTGGTASDDDTHSDPQYQPDKAVDGSISTRWSTGGATPLPHWWKYDLGYTLDLCTDQTKAISDSEFSTYINDKAFDNSSTEGQQWGTNTAGDPTGVAWLGYDFGTGVTKAIRRVRIDFENTSYSTSVKIQYSDNGTSWSDAYTATGLTQTYNTVDIPDSGSHRYWRILANGPLVSGTYFSIYECEMMEFKKKAADLLRIYGVAGDITAWEFQGSNDDFSTFDVLYWSTGGAIPQAWNDYQLTNTTAYRYYRMYITAETSDYYCSFFEIQAFEKGWTQIPASQTTFDQHIAADQADPKYIEITNNTLYRYYALKFANNWGSTGLMGLRRIRLQTEDDYVSYYSPEQTNTYVKATSSYYANPAEATNPTKSLVGSEVGNCWSAYPATSNQRFHIDLGSARIISRIYYENMHISGGILEGMKDFTFWGSNDAGAFADLTYGDDTGWTQLTTDVSIFDQHIAVDIADPKYVYVTNITAYRYYAVKIATSYPSAISCRRIELQAIPETATTITQDILSDAKVKVIDIQSDILSDTDIVNDRVQEDVLSDAKIKVLNVQKDILSDTKIKILDIQQDTLSDAKVVTQSQEDVLSDATMKKVGIQEDVLSDAKIKILGLQQNILADAVIFIRRDEDILSDAKVKVLGLQQNILSDAKIKVTGIQEPILSDAEIIKYYSQYPPAQNDTYVKTTTEFPGYPGYFSTDPTKSLTGDEYPNQWYSDVGNNTNQRFHIDLGSAKAIKRIYYENMHYFGTLPEYGVKNFKIYGSNSITDFDEFAYGTNQLVNGAFDDWNPPFPNVWHLWGGSPSATVVREETIVHSGSFSLKLTSNNDEFTPMQQDISAVEGIAYWQGKEVTLSCWVWADTPGVGGIFLHDGIDDFWSSMHTGDSTWQLLSVTATLNIAANQVTIQLATQQNATVYFDDVELIDESINVVPNPGFEYWSSAPTNWFFHNWLSTSTVEQESIIIKDGLYSAKLTKGDAECSLMQQIGFTKGLAYWQGRSITFKGWVWSDVPNSAELGIADGVVGVGTRHSGSGNWEYLTICKTIDPFATMVMPYCSVYETGTCYFDSCKVVEDADGEVTYNNDFERWDAGDNVPPTGWELYSNQPIPDLTAAKESTIVHGGTYSLKLHREGGSPENWFGQKLFTEFGNPIPFNKGIEYWRGKTVRFSIWVYASVADKASIYIWDGISGSGTGYHTGDSTWQLLEVTHTFAWNATDATVNMWCSGEGTGVDASCYFDDAVVVNLTPYGTELPTNKTLFDQHALVDAPDPKYILVDNVNAYRYYTLKFFDNWGAGNMSVRRIELQTSDQIGNILSDAKIKWLGRQQTIDADSKIVNQYQEELLSDAKIKVRMQQTILSKARVRWFTKIFYASYSLVKNVTQNFYGRTTVLQVTPLVPTNLRARDLVKGDAIQLSWDADANYGYNVYKIASRTLVNTYPIIGTNEYVVGGLTTGTSYDFVVVGVNGIGVESADSNLASAIPTFPNYTGLASRFQSYTYSVKINNVVRKDAFLSTVELGYGTSPAVARFMISADPDTLGLPVNNDAVEVIVNNRSIFKGTVKNIEKSISSSGMAVTYIAYSRALNYMQESVSWDYVLQYRELYNLDLADQTYLQAQETIANFLGNYRIYYNMNTDTIEQYKLGTGFWNRAVTIGKNVIDWNVTYDTTNQVTKVTVRGDRTKTTKGWSSLSWTTVYLIDHRPYYWQAVLRKEISAFNIADVQVEAFQSTGQPRIDFDPEISVVPSDFGRTHWDDDTVESKQKIIRYFNPVEEWKSTGVQVDYVYKKVGNEDIPIKAILTLTSDPKVYRAHIDFVGAGTRVGRTPAEDVHFNNVSIAMATYEYPCSFRVSYSYSKETPETSPAGSGAPSRTVTDTQYKPFNDVLNAEDDRAYVASQMALRATGELEKVNRPVVSGRIQILGDETFDLKTLVEVEGQKLDVVRVVHNFGSGFTTDIELTNEKFRINIPPYQEMRRTIAYQRQITGTQALLDSYRRKMQQMIDTRYTEQEKSGSIPKSPYSIYGD
jgi:hypothetical protein